MSIYKTNDFAIERKAAFVMLELVFISVVVFLPKVAPSPLVLVAMAFATLRLARTISYNEIFSVWREPFTEVKPDSCGAGDGVCPKGDGWKYVIGSLIACPICSGQWAALILYSLYVLFPFGATLIYVLAIAGVSELLHWGAEASEWIGRATRVYSGHTSPDKP